MQKRDLMHEYARVTESHPCPVCGRPDWCLIQKDGHGAICQRTKSDKPKGKAGWYHDVDTDAPAVQRVKPKLSHDDLMGKLSRLMPVREADARILRLPHRALYKIGTRWDPDRKCIVFPMTDGLGHVVGARLRWHNGDKRSISGGTEGVFAARTPIQSYVFITEGPTDTAAIIGLGLVAIGRPSCNGGLEEIKRLVPRYTNIIILADPDGPGVAGASKLAMDLRDRPVTILQSDCDARDYVERHPGHASRMALAHGWSYHRSGSDWRVIYRNVEAARSDTTVALNDIFNAKALT